MRGILRLIFAAVLRDAGPRPASRRGRLGWLLCLVLLAACDRTPLEPWHTARLDEEFSAARLDEVRSFADYLALEDRLFAQLRETVHTRVPTGPEQGLVRFSTGSAADPFRREPNWNRSFELRSSQPRAAVLLVHGMSDGPYSLKSLGEALQAQGYWVIGLRLPGHGTAPAGLLGLRWQDMAAAVSLAAAYLAEQLPGQPLHLVGYSNGAPLAVNFALDAMAGLDSPVPASLVLVSPAMGLATGAGFASWKRNLSVLPGLGHWAWHDIQPEFDPYKYNSFATNAGAQVHELTQHVTRRITALAGDRSRPVLPPTLVFKSTVDATVSTSALIDNFLQRLNPGRHELVLFDINRFAAVSSVLIDDPGPLTGRVMSDHSLPFDVTLVANRDPSTLQTVALRKGAFSAAVAEVRDLGLAWPRDVLSLSHVALPFSPTDPLYGEGPPGSDKFLFLGQQAIQGERGLMRLPPEWLLRLRHNPFYSYLEERALNWLEEPGVSPD